MAKRKRRNRRRQPNPVAPLTNQQLNHLANQMLHPIQAQANHQAQATQGFGQALANIYGDIAPTVQGAYSNAADKTASYGQGFSHGLQLLADQANQGTSDFLQQQGLPTGNQNVAAGASDALYGSGGYIPASTLQREGAAFTSAAAMAPTYAGRQAQQDATRLRMEALQQIAQQRPQVLQALRDFELQKYAARLNAQALGLNRQDQRFQHRLDQANLALDVQHEANQQQQTQQQHRGDRQEFWQDTRSNALDLAQKLAEGHEVPNPNPFGSSDTIIKHFSYREARARLMNAYGADLRQHGFSRDRIRRMIDQVLRAAGFHKPRKQDHTIYPQIPPGGFPEGL